MSVSGEITPDGEAAAERIYQLAYLSTNRMRGDPEEPLLLAGLLIQSRRNNVRDGITGALVLSGSVIAQVLEGPREKVEALFERIRWDDRHGQIMIIEQGFVPERAFAEWDMACVPVGPDQEAVIRALDLPTTVPRPPGAAGRAASAVLDYLVHAQ
ncbi:BLUF domain-containing protein [Roseomonas sp. CCTCC AB2023176]|uniref:BLUF domain-containing protein n=1 Tax=Roseomonas sp. CCTCC AB2023176 TaxID=3342640 RepID=UPI0035E10541